MSTNEIKALVKRKDELETQLEEVEKLLQKAREEVAGVHPGDIVIYKGVEHRVTHVDVSWGDREKPWVRGNPKRKDGTFGTADRHLYYHWEKA